MEKYRIESNHIGPDGSPMDRIYSNPNGNVRLIQADYTDYQGKIHKKQLILKGIDGSNFKSHCFVTDDGRWFDRTGIPMLKPNEIVEDEDNRTEDSQDTEEGIEASSETQDEESVQGSVETDSVVAPIEERKINED
jgi:hypothetical protein